MLSPWLGSVMGWAVSGAAYVAAYSSTLAVVVGCGTRGKVRMSVGGRGDAGDRKNSGY